MAVWYSYEARFTNKIPGVHVLPEFRAGMQIQEMWYTTCFTKLKPRSFVIGPFIGFGMLPWLLGTNSGGTSTS